MMTDKFYNFLIVNCLYSIKALFMASNGLMKKAD